MTTPILAGAATVDITPVHSVFLHGYPHVERYSTGVHDPLLASALCLTDGKTPVLFIANDLLYVTMQMTRRVRKRVADSTGIPAPNIMVTATHTHSGPVTVRLLSEEADPVVPAPEPACIRRLEDGMVAAAERAYEALRPAEAGLVVADGSAVGSNRRDPAGPRDPDVPVLILHDHGNTSYLAAMIVCSMHPTVLHEDSTLITGDFPAMAREYLQQNVLGNDCPVIYHTGAAGNQSPRHVTQANTFQEAERLGHRLGESIARAIDRVEYHDRVSLHSQQVVIEDLPLRRFPPPEEAETRLVRARDRLDRLRRDGAPRTDIRTAECDWFGAEETLTLARAAAAGRLEAVAATCLPAEVQILHVGPWAYCGWPCEVFVEFVLAVKRRRPNAHVITLANGTLQSYLVTAEAMREGGYEALNALFLSPDSGWRLVDATIELLTGKA